MAKTKKQLAAERARLIKQAASDGKVGRKDVNSMRRAGMNAKQIRQATTTAQSDYGARIGRGVKPKFAPASPAGGDAQTARKRAQERGKRRGANASTDKLVRVTTKDDNKFGGKDVKLLKERGYTKKQIRDVASSVYEQDGLRVGNKIRERFGLGPNNNKKPQSTPATQDAQAIQTGEQIRPPGQAPQYDPSRHNSGEFGATGSDGFIKTYWGNAPEVTLDYANDLGRYNSRNLDFLDSRARATKAADDRAMQRLVSSVPKFKEAEDTTDSDFADIERFADLFSSIGRD